MSEIRRTRDECLNCAKEVPPRVERDENPPNCYTYYCAKCSNKVMEHIVAKDGNFSADGLYKNPPQKLLGPEVAISSDVSFNTMEVVWTRKTSMAFIHGRKVYGPEGSERFAYGVIENVC